MLSVSLSEFRQTLALADAKRRDHERKSGERSSNISNTYCIVNTMRACAASQKSYRSKYSECLTYCWNNTCVVSVYYKVSEWLLRKMQIRWRLHLILSLFDDLCVWWHSCSALSKPLEANIKKGRKLPVLLNSMFSSPELSDKEKLYNSFVCRGQYPSARLFK